MKSLSLPTVDSRRDFQLGGVYAVVLLALIAMIFFRILEGLDEIHSYALQKSTAVTVSLSTVPLPTSKQNDTPRPVPKPKQEEAAAVEEKSAPVEDISSLFSEVKTQKIVHKAKPKPSNEIDAKRIAALQKRIKTTQKRAVSKTAESVKNLSLVKPAQPAGGAQASGGKEVDAYLGKIQAVIYDNFFPPANSQGSVAQIRIWVSVDGKLTRFKVLRRSGEPFFDQEVERLEQRLKSVSFGHNPNEKETVFDIRLVSKE